MLRDSKPLSRSFYTHLRSTEINLYKVSNSLVKPTYLPSISVDCKFTQNNWKIYSVLLDFTNVTVTELWMFPKAAKKIMEVLSNEVH